MGRVEENIKDWEDSVGGRTERESKERDTLIEGASMGLVRNLAPGKFPKIYKDDPS